MKKLILLLVLLNCYVSRSQKIAWVNFDSLVRAMPEAKLVREESEKYLRTLSVIMNDKQKEMEQRVNEYVGVRDKLNDEQKKLREEELQMLQTKIDEFRQNAEKDYQAKRYELAAPLIDKAKKGIEAVAKENGYKFVFDINGTLIYGEPGADIFSQSKKKLDGMPAAKIAGSSPKIAEAGN